MKQFTRLCVVMAGVLALPAVPSRAALAFTPDAAVVASPGWIARGGGGGGGGGRGGGGGSRGGFSGGGGHSGFSGAGSANGLNRGANRPQGGWADNSRGNRAGGGPSLDRQPVSRPSGGYQRPEGGYGSNRPAGSATLGDRTINGGDRNFNGQVNRNFNGQVNRNWNRTVNINNVNLNPGWARPGWGYARPWNFGWYGGWTTPSWGWWGASAAVWGVSTLATAAIINAAVDNAVANSTTYIVVPNTGYQLQFGTVQPYGTTGVSFVVTANNISYQMTADCTNGLLNGAQPASAQEAELLNSACQIAFGTAR